MKVIDIDINRRKEEGKRLLVVRICEAGGLNPSSAGQVICCKVKEAVALTLRTLRIEQIALR